MNLSKRDMLNVTVDTLYDWVEDRSPAEDILSKHVRDGLAGVVDARSERSFLTKCLRAAFIVGMEHAEPGAPSEDDAARTSLERADDCDDPLPF